MIILPITIRYETVYERALRHINDTELAQLMEDDFYDFLKEWLHSAVSLPQFRRQFKLFELDDEVMAITFDLNNSVDTTYDTDFVKTILSEGVVINYFPSKIDTGVNMSTMIGGKEEKKLLDNYGKMQERLNTLEVKLGRELAQHGYYFGKYGG